MENSATAPAYTSGPWSVEPARPGQYLIVLDDGSCIATVGDGPHEGGPDQVLRANATLIAASPALRESSQRLYDALQDYLRVPDSELPEDLVRAMDEMEAAWRKANGTIPDPSHGNAA